MKIFVIQPKEFQMTPASSSGSILQSLARIVEGQLDTDSANQDRADLAAARHRLRKGFYRYLCP